MNSFIINAPSVQLMVQGADEALKILDEISNKLKEHDSYEIFIDGKDSMRKRKGLKK